MRIARERFTPSTPARLVAGLALLAHGMSSAVAAEGGFNQYPWGAQTTYAAHMPPAGKTAFFGYFLFLDGDSVRDSQGDKIPGVSAEVYALVPRIVHSWETSFFGWKMSSAAEVQFLHVNVKVPGAEDNDVGPALIGIEPLYLSKSFGSLTFLHGPLVYIGLGSYDRDDLANSNLNQNSLAYQANLSWNPNARVDVSLNAAVNVQTENDETRYRSGPTAGLSFGAGYKPFAELHWDFGFSGYYVDGLSDDEVDGQDVAGGGRSKKFAIGPKVVYWFTQNTAVVAQIHHETEIENGTKGDLFWLEATFPL